MALALLPGAGLLSPRAGGDCAFHHPLGAASLKRYVAPVSALLGMRHQGRNNDAPKLGRLAYRLASVSGRREGRKVGVAPAPGRSALSDLRSIILCLGFGRCGPQRLGEVGDPRVRNMVSKLSRDVRQHALARIAPLLHANVPDFARFLRYRGGFYLKHC
jgi:hypothetical protein